MSLRALLAGTFAVLAVATVAGQLLRLKTGGETVRNMNVRIASWWVLIGLTAAALLAGFAATCVLFAAVSLLALGEFLKLAGWPTGLLVCVVGVVGLWHVPALLATGGAPELVFWYLLVAQSSDVLQWTWGKLLGRTPAAPRISPGKTWEGYVGGVLSAIALGAALHAATPFGPLKAAAVSAVVTLLGVAGGLTMSAIKRRSGVKDSGAIVPGHGGILDRIDSLFLSAPAFFWLMR
jgi:phosphatidate cytidylyltransferase